MTRNTSSILLSLCLVPVVFGFGGLLVMTLNDGMNVSGDVVVWVTTVATLLFVYVYWTLTWSGAAWATRRRRIKTLLALCGSLGVGALTAGLVFYAAEWDANEEAAVFGTLAAGITYVVATVFVWRETTDERIERLKDAGAMAFAEMLLCGKCGYAMVGLTHARCPECGTEYTLEALWAANAERMAIKADPTAGFGA